MRKAHARLSLVGAVLAVALFAAGCTNPAPPGGYTMILRATQLTNIDANDVGGLGNFWDNDFDDEPVLVHLGIRIKLNEPVAITTVATSYDAQGAYSCDVAEGDTCSVNPGDGVVFGGVYLPDIVDLQNGSQPFELIGSIELAFEKDTPLGVGGALTAFFQGLSGLINAAVGPILAGGGALPTDPNGLLNFISAVIPPAIAALLGLIGTQLISAPLGGDQFIGLAPMFFFAVGGSLGSLLANILPSLLQLINQILPTLENSPFPNGLPIQLGVLGQAASLTFGSEFEAPFTKYEALYFAEVI